MQEIAEAVLDAEMKVGELTAKIPKASGARTDLTPADTAVERSTKSESLSEIGISQRQAERYEQLAKHPEIVEKTKQEARKRGEVGLLPIRIRETKATYSLHWRKGQSAGVQQKH